jgi:PBP1b-binding outer membrane lipoprotein LpoB
MKKIILAGAILLLLSGCVDENSKILNEKNAPADLGQNYVQFGGYNEAEVIKRMIDLKNGAKPKVAPKPKKSEPKPQIPVR